MDDFNKLMSSFKKDRRIKECFHHNSNECKGKIKQAHSIQRNGRLSIIESEVNGNNCIYTFTSHTTSEKYIIEDLVPIGKKEASTFFGFCDYHDSTLFSPIENFKFNRSNKHLFLHSYRSFAHSYHRKLEDSKIYNNPNSEFIKALPSFQVNWMKEGIEMSVKDSKKHKQLLDIALDSKNYNYLEYLVYEKKGLYPFAVSSQMSPRVTYTNKPMNNHVDPNIPWSQPMITFLPDQDSTFVIIAAFPDDLNSIILINELKSLKPLDIEKAITSLIIANCENTFFSPKVWNKLNSKQKRIFLDEFEVNTKGSEYHDKFFHSRINFFSDYFEINNL